MKTSEVALLCPHDCHDDTWNFVSSCPSYEVPVFAFTIALHNVSPNWSLTPQGVAVVEATP